MKYDVIIIGAGQAGFSTAVSLRQKQYKGSILLIGNEKYLPYQRPPLSKKFLSDIVEVKSLLLKSYAFFQRQDITILTNSYVSEINKEAMTITLENQKKLNYKKLVICTGSKVNRMNFSCNEDRAFYLRTIDDAIQIKNAIKFSKEIVFLGGGYISLEIASATIKQGVNVTIVEKENRLMKRSVSKCMANFLQSKHESEGVRILLNTSVRDINDWNNKKRIHLSDGNSIDAEAVIIGVGIQPQVNPALQSNIKCNNGIEVDEHGKTSDKNIFSAGDCTFHPNNIFSTKIRLESVHNAVEQGKTVAASIVGLKEPYNQTPWFWSEQYNCKLKIAGLIHNYDSHITYGDVKEESFAIFFIKDRKIIAVEAMNNQKAFLRGKKLITRQSLIPKKFMHGDKQSLTDWIFNN